MDAERKQIIMNFSTPPSLEDIQVLAEEAFESLPEELAQFCDELEIRVDDFPDAALEQDMDLESPYDLVALYICDESDLPGTIRKLSNDTATFTFFRRPLLDEWCDAGEDLNMLIRQVMITEIGQTHGFSDDELQEMSNRHYQGMFFVRAQK